MDETGLWATTLLSGQTLTFNEAARFLSWFSEKHQCKEYAIRGPSKPDFHDHEPRFDFELEIEGHLKHHCIQSKGVLQGARKVVLGAAITLIDKEPDQWKEWLKEKESREKRSKGDSEEAKKLRWESLCEMMRIEWKLRHEAAWSCAPMVKYLDSTFIPEIYGHERFQFRDNLRRDQEAMTEWNLFKATLDEHEEDFRLVREQLASLTISNQATSQSIFYFPSPYMRAADSLTVVCMEMLEMKLEKAEKPFRDLTSEYEEDLAQLEEGLKQFRDESAQAKRDSVLLRQELEDSKEQARQARQELEQSDEEVTRLKLEQSRWTHEEIELRTKLEHSEEHLSIAKKDLDRLREELVESRLELRKTREELAQKSRQLLNKRSETTAAASSPAPLCDADSTPSSLGSTQLRDVIEELDRFKLRLVNLEARQPG
ncbi:hypothetical protein JCM5350_006121 [Sporobolomyces pararoseus]